MTNGAHARHADAGLSAEMLKRVAYRGTLISLVVFHVTVCILAAHELSFLRGLDEPAHVSYALEILRTGSLFPDIASIRLLEPDLSGLDQALNYINHPPVYYWIMAAIAAFGDSLSEQVLLMRLANVVLSAGVVLCAVVLARWMGWSRPVRLLFLSSIIFTPVLWVLGGYVTNDNQAILGGALLVLGALGLLKGQRHTGIWGLCVMGLFLAVSSKATAALSVDVFLVIIGGHVLLREPALLRHPGLWAVALAGAIGHLPYVWLALSYGSPVPSLPGTGQLMAPWLEAFDWDKQRLTFPQYALHFFTTLAKEWYPPLSSPPRMPYLLAAVPLAALTFALAQMANSLRGIFVGREDAMTLLLAAGTVALAVLLVAHLNYNYASHLRTGWLRAIWPRYYMALLFVPAIGTASFVALLTEQLRTVAALLVSLLLAAVWLIRMAG